MTIRALLDQAAGLAAGYLESLPDRPGRLVGRRRGTARRASAARCRRAPTDPRRGDRRARRRRRARARRRSRAAATSASSSAARSPRRSRPTGSPRRGTRTPGCRRRPVRGGGRGGRRRLAGRAARAARRRRRSASSPAARWRTSPRWRPRATRCSRGWAGTSTSEGLIGAPPVRVLVGDERHVTGRPRAAVPRARHRCVDAVAADGQGRMRARRAARGARAGDGRRSSARRPATSTRARSTRSRRSPTSPHDGGRVAARRRRLRAVGGGEPALAAPRRRRRARRLVGDRRAQVAQRPLRLRDRLLRAPRGAAGRDGRPRRLPRSTRIRRARATSCDWNPEFSRRARGFAGLRRDPVARPRGDRRAGRALLRPRAPLRRCARAAAGVEVLNDVVLNQVLVRFLDDAGDHDAHTRSVIAGRAGRRHLLARRHDLAGHAARCASRSRTGRRPPRTSSGRSRRSSRRRRAATLSLIAGVGVTPPPDPSGPDCARRTQGGPSRA